MKSFDLVGRFFRTLKDLKFKQIIFLLLRKIQKPYLFNPKSFSKRKLKSEVYFGPESKSSVREKNCFDFLNKEKHFRNKIDWNDEQDLLWTYNLNYFDYLNSTDADHKKDFLRYLILQWIDDNSVKSSVAWQPYPMSLRIVNWIKWSLKENKENFELDRSIQQQSQWLSKNVEHHILANHLIANYKALLFAGFYFKGRQADSWLNKYKTLLIKELDLQIFDDGGHFERSPMYHRTVLVDLLDIINIYRIYNFEVPAEFNIIATKMLSFMIDFSHIDRKVPFFHDSVFGISPEYKEIIDYSDKLGIVANIKQGNILFSQSGYVRLRNKTINLLMDVGSIGPRFQPGHSHASTLSLECSFLGKRFIVNSGISTYEPTNKRIEQRGTSSHNTIEIDGFNSSEVWSSFRVGRKAKAKVESYSRSNSVIKASHNGYNWLKSIKGVTRFAKISENSIEIVDDIFSSGSFSAKGRWYIHPEIRLIGSDDRKMQYIFSLKTENGERLIAINISGAKCSRLEESEFFPGFNMVKKNYCLTFTYNGNCNESVKSNISLLE